MDPQATLGALLDSLANLEDQPAEHAENLVAWLGNGGFSPSLNSDILTHEDQETVLRGFLQYVISETSTI